MDRRSFIAGPAALAVASPVALATELKRERPFEAIPLQPDAPWRPDNVRERLALVVAAYSEPTVAHPEPLDPDDAAAVLAFTDAEIQVGDKVIDFCARNGVSIDWIYTGELKTLLLGARKRHRNPS